MELVNKIDYYYDSLDEAFPPCDPGIAPCGSRVLVQIRTPKRKTKGGILLTEEVREIEIYNTQIGKVLSTGPVAFCNRNTLEPWPEGSWCSPGDFVRIPKYAGDRFTVKTLDGEDDVYLVVFNDLDLIAKVTGDPTLIRAFL